jgi:hypothetical protein
VIFPGEFIDFHVRIGAVAGSLIPSGRYLELWPAGVLLSYNTGYNVAGFVPGVVLIGDNGGTTAYALDYGGRDVTYIAVPFIGLAREEIEGIASTFEAFIAALAEREVVV